MENTTFQKLQDFQNYLKEKQNKKTEKRDFLTKEFNQDFTEKDDNFVNGFYNALETMKSDRVASDNKKLVFRSDNSHGPENELTSDEVREKDIREMCNLWRLNSDEQQDYYDGKPNDEVDRKMAIPIQRNDKVRWE